MEKRAILAAVLMAALLILYQLLFLPSSPPAPPSPPPEPQPAPAAPPPLPPAPPPERVGRPALPQRTVSVEGPLFRGTLGSDGGKLHEWVLRYRGDKPMVVPGILGPAGVVLERPGLAREAPGFRLEGDRLSLLPDRPWGELRLVGEDPYGAEVVETLRFARGDYRVEVMLRLVNRRPVAQVPVLLLPWAAPRQWPKDLVEAFPGQAPQRVLRRVGGELGREELAAAKPAAAAGEWIALESNWYIVALVPVTPGFELVTSGKEGEAVEIALRATPGPLAPGQAWEGRALLYVGPKEYDRLAALGVGLEEAVDFGGFPLPRAWGGLPMKWLAVPILWLMNFVHDYVPNYGVAIMILTVVTKILFYPLTLKSMASMKAMQALQPQVNALRAKYQKDPQRLQRETMELYRKHKVNPLGGCLPMVIQIPIFYALYLVFSLSVELQSAPFLCLGRTPHWVPLLGGMELWICNLATHDPTYVLPLLMGASMFIQQKLSPTVGDPRQARIMLLMPVLFTFMFLNLPSGLVLYWTVSNALQILQQHYMNRGGSRAATPRGKEAKEAQRA